MEISRNLRYLLPWNPPDSHSPPVSAGVTILTTCPVQSNDTCSCSVCGQVGSSKSELSKHEDREHEALPGTTSGLPGSQDDQEVEPGGGGMDRDGQEGGHGEHDRRKQHQEGL